MTQQASDMVQREKASLWRLKHLLTTFRGDETWAPCGFFQTEDDIKLFGREGPVGVGDFAGAQEEDIDRSLLVENTRIGSQQHSHVDLHGPAVISKDSSAKLEHTNGRPDPQLQSGNAAIANYDSAAAEDGERDPLHGYSKTDGDRSRDGGGPTREPEIAKLNDMQQPHLPEKFGVQELAPAIFAEHSTNDGQTTMMPASTIGASDNHDMQSATVPGDPNPGSNAAERGPPDIVTTMVENEEQAVGPDGDGDGGNLQPAQHRMTTRAQAQAASDIVTGTPTGSPSPASSTFVSVHPFFLIPSSAHPDRDFGLPLSEADDTRRLLMLYVQKQEEICRGVEKLYDGLLRADRMRKTVLQWCKAEDHVGEMSDGEDWYDKEDWGLEEDLKKGHEEEEDEGGNQGKKTRGRRA